MLYCAEHRSSLVYDDIDPIYTKYGKFPF